MKQFAISFLFLAALVSCKHGKEIKAPQTDVWKNRMVEEINDSNLMEGSTFLSIYPQIYLRNDNSQYDLTVTVSLHNPNEKDSLYIHRADYFNTEGNPIHKYFNNPIYIRPMETVQIIIPALDNKGGTGANFVFDWKKKVSSYDPIFEAIMVSSLGMHGVSFVTEGKRLR